MNLNKFYRRHTSNYDDRNCDDDDDEVNLLAGVRDTDLLGDERRRAIRYRQQIIDKTIQQEQGCELRTIQGDQYTYYEIQPGDSLQGICLRFSLEINQVKRLNNLMTDQDFYGLKHLKLPLGKFKLLQSTIKNSPGSAHRDLPSPPNNFKPLLSPDHSSYGVEEINGIGEGDQTVNRIFENVDQGVEKIKQAVLDYHKRGDEIIEAIHVEPSLTSPETSRIPELFFSGENFGLNIKMLVLLIIIVCIVIPLIYMYQAHVI